MIENHMGVTEATPSILRKFKREDVEPSLKSQKFN